MGRAGALVATLVAALPVAGLAGLLGLAFHDRYWRWRDCFRENGEGRCWGCDGTDDCHVYLEQAGPIWGGLALVCAATAVLILLYGLRPRHRGPGRPIPGRADRP